MQNKDNRISMTAWVLVTLPWIGYILTSIGNYSIGMMLPGMRQELGFGLVEAGYLSAVAWVSRIIITIPITSILTRIKAKDILTGIFLSMGIGFALQGMSTNMIMLYVGRALSIGVMATILTILVAIKIKWIPMSKITYINGIENFAGTAGQMLGTIIIPALLVLLSGWRNVEFVMSAMSFILAIAWVVFGKDTKPEPKKVIDEKSGRTNPLLGALKLKELWLLAFAWPFSILAWISMYTFWPTYAIESLGLSLTQAGFILGLLPLFSMLSSLITPWLAEKAGYEKPFIWVCGFVMPLAYLAMLNTSNVILLSVAAAFAGYTIYTYVPIAFSVLYKVPGVDSEVVALGISIIYTTIGIGGALGGIVAGKLSATYGLYTGMTICCLSPLVFGTVNLFLPEYGRKYREREAAKNLSGEKRSEQLS